MANLKIPAFRRKKQLKKKLSSCKGCGCAKKKKKIVKKPKKAKKIVVKKKAAVKPVKLKLAPVGMVTHFYDKISVAVLKLTGTLKTGDKLQLKGKKGDFKQVVSSIQIEHQPVGAAKKGDDIGLKVDKPVKTDQVAYLVK